MIALSTAIYQRAMADAPLQLLIGGRFFETEAPQETDLPYAVYSVISDTNASTFTEKIESLRVQFSAVSGQSSSAEVKNILAALETCFDKASFTVTTSNVVSGKVEDMSWESKFFDRYIADDGQSEWNGYLDFTVLYQRY